MLVAALRRRGTAWLAQLAELAPAAGRGLLMGGSLSSGGGVNAGRRALASTAASAAANAPAAAGAAATGSAAAAAKATRKQGAAGAARQGPTVLLVESPAKARKIQDFLGPDYKVLASYGHIRDLPARGGSVDPDSGFAMKWQVLGAAEARLPAIASAVRQASRLVLATDPDREGEAISWHLVQELQGRRAILESTTTQRITFTEVTKRAVLEALQRPRDISEPLVHAYMARRALDYLFGFHLSPMLWRKVPGARSAGRVQSVALRLVCEREAAIDAFQQHKYYTVEADLQLPGGSTIQARLAGVDGASPPQPGFPDQQAAAAVAARVAAARFTVREASSREQQRQPPPPFTTSTLQQEANKRLGLGASRTMQLAQQLYESGHISYMRTDGVSLAPAAVEALRQAAAAEHGAQYVAAEARVYRSRSKNAQEAHEAIRPTDPLLTAEQLAEQGVERPAAKLYGWVAVAADLASEDDGLQLRATASASAFPGFLAAYFDPAAISAAADGGKAEDEAGAAQAEEEGEGEGEGEGAAVSSRRRAQQEAARAAAVAGLAAIRRGQEVGVSEAAASEHETRPPARYTEGSLVKHLEELGIGRPSTYAPTINARGYVRKEGRALHAEALGRVLTAFLQAYFPQYVDFGFTSSLEEQLDEVSGGGTEWQDVLRGFWAPFTDTLDHVGGVPVTHVIDRMNEMVGDQLIGEDRTCPSCGGQLSIKFVSKSKVPPFVGCSLYPSCKYSRPIQVDWTVEEPAVKKGTMGEGEEQMQAEKGVALTGLSGYARLLGDDPSSGMPVFVRAGLYGPYVQRGNNEEEQGFRRQALPRLQHMQHKVVTLALALEMLALPKDLGLNPATGESVLVSMGKFGPFIRCGALSRAVPKEYDPLKLSLPDALQLLAGKTIYSTGRAARKVAAALAGPPNGAAATGKGEVRRRRGRPRRVDELAAAVVAAVATGEARPEAGEEAGLLDGDDVDSAAHKAQVARLGARIALDAAAEVEVEQLKAALKLTDGPAMAAARAAAASKPRNYKRGPSAYTLYFRSVMQEAERTGDKWWRAPGRNLAKEVGAQWTRMSPEERRPYEEQATNEQLQAAALEHGLLPEGTEVATLAPAQRAELEAEVAQRDARGISLDETLQKKREPRRMAWLAVNLPRPPTAYNLFTNAHIHQARQGLGPAPAGSEIMLRLSEMWRSATILEKSEFKLEAEEELRAYKEAKAQLSQQQQAAVAAALAEGLPPVAAARAGMLAGQALIEEYLRQRAKRVARVAAKKAATKGS
ncbi:hypothetical protein CHLNCDRAFT_145197 [Chlorella variabilis]|uniref:DNA topoisomerase n=1 Tax=Chlorella variabilis TaxID=554065 RepID=E1ZDW6_CHLVA|nr:hypothetical protein CHLNCDRAFT_145197 [Chlorella variabilis]EFN55927.1 hypothetical protein CHLNCDRAFT_145197 [Chlorella variabilis]|eukprot:XP_005848029.1 hypothetical protein CHLNCDRAFT_145197 [Chlorella variabilis]